MLTQTINFCKFIFFLRSDYLQKICHILYLEMRIPLQLVIFHLIFTPKR